MFTPSGCKDMNIRKVLFVAKTHILVYNSTIKELSLNHKIKLSNLYIFATWWCKP